MIGGLEVASFSAPVEPTMMLLFTKTDVRIRRCPPDQKPYHSAEDDGLVTCHELAVSRKDLLDRLDVLGISRSVVTEAFNVRVADAKKILLEILPTIDVLEVSASALEELEALDGLTFTEWCSEVARHARSLDDWQEHSATWRRLRSLWDYDDPRFVVRAYIEAMLGDLEVVFDVTDLAEAGWLRSGDPRAEALEHFQWVATNGSPAIIFSEGKTDAEFLDAALRILRPHLSGFIRIANFDSPREGSAGALVNTVRTLAAAGIANRVVALFDNDTAAAEALTSLQTSTLPPNIAVIQLPDTPLGTQYPTIGPEGPARSEINGRAASIELYLGHDVLTYPGSQELRPVQWTGFSHKLRRYQGEVVDRQAIHDAFGVKVRAAERDSVARLSQDWSGLELVLDAAQSALARLNGLEVRS
jgi:hypothetical protein